MYVQNACDECLEKEINWRNLGGLHIESDISSTNTNSAGRKRKEGHFGQSEQYAYEPRSIKGHGIF